MTALPLSPKSELLKIGEAATLLGVCPKTLRNWDRSKKLVPQRNSVTGYRYYARPDLLAFLAAHFPQRLAELEQIAASTPSPI